MNPRRHRAVWALLAILGAGCVTPQPRLLAPNAAAPTASVGDYTPRIDDPATWQGLAATPGRQVMARTEVVKVIIDLVNNGAVYFLQSRRWPIHYDFAWRFLSTVMHPVEVHEVFNIAQYRRADRRFVLGTLTRYRDQDVWAYSLVAGDTLDLASTARAFEAIRRRVFFGDRLRYHPIPPAHEAGVAALEAAGLPLVTTQTLFGALRYQPVNPGEAYGYLRFVTEPLSPTEVRRTDVVVMDTVPLDLPVCAGIVTGQLQAPLGHVAVLATNRGTPDMALRGAFRDPALRALEGRLVRLRVTPQEYSVVAARQDDAERAWARARPPHAVSPPYTAHALTLRPVASLRMVDVGTVGAKAAQLGELASIGGAVEVPRGVAVPFRAYREHLAQGGFDAALRDAMARDDFRDDVTVRARVLAEMRARIEALPVAPALLVALRAQIVRQLGSGRIRLRSSTNAEDLPGFNGAGLYRSVVIEPGASDAALANALRAVWASTWNLQAYEERAWFRIDQSAVAMGVLVQTSIDDDVVNGVAITANPFDAGRPGLFVNAQVAGAEGGAVTSARGDEIPEQIVYYTYGAAREFERIARSTRVAPGATVLSDDEVYGLAQSLQAIHRHFNPLEIGVPETAMDVEFLLAGPRRRLVFVQARPYTLRYDFGRNAAEGPEDAPR